MGITRRNLFGVAPGPVAGSTNTSRLVPMTLGNQPTTAWPLQAPGSANSCTNMLPLWGTLRPRSRLSSINTIRFGPSGGAGISSMFELPGIGNASPQLWVSASTTHGVVTSNGSISQASFTSANGLGVAGLGANTQWQYTWAYSANLDRNMVIAAGDSGTTLLCIYQTSGSAVPQVSYLTSAPKAKCVCSHDAYLVVFNTQQGSATQTPARVQWTARGSSSFTVEGSGFEDLGLSMRGIGTAIVSAADGRLILFSDAEIYYGLSAPYPSQFVFAPLDQSIGCPFGKTVQQCPEGILFVGSDFNLRLLPLGGGISQIIAPSLAPVLRPTAQPGFFTRWVFGVYDRTTGLYYLQLDYDGLLGTDFGVVVNIRTGEWSYTKTAVGNILMSGTQAQLSNCQYTLNEGLWFANSSGTLFSTNSLIYNEDGGLSAAGPVTATWRSAPIAPELAGNWKQLTKVCLDYRSTSKSTVTLKISQDGGNTYEPTGRLVSLPSAPASGRAESDVYVGGAFPVLELTSNSTGWEYHRVDVSMNIGGRK